MCCGGGLGLFAGDLLDAAVGGGLLDHFGGWSLEEHLLTVGGDGAGEGFALFHEGESELGAGEFPAVVDGAAFKRSGAEDPGVFGGALGNGEAGLPDDGVGLAVIGEGGELGGGHLVVLARE